MRISYHFRLNPCLCLCLCLCLLPSPVSRLPPSLLLPPSPVFSGRPRYSDGQKCLFCPTGRGFCEFGTRKRVFLGHARLFLRVRDTKKGVFGYARRVLRTWDPKKGVFGVRQAVFAVLRVRWSEGGGKVEGRWWEGGFSGFGSLKRQFWATGGDSEAADLPTGQRKGHGQGEGR